MLTVYIICAVGWAGALGFWIYVGPIRKDWFAAMPVSLIMLVFAVGMMIAAFSMD